MAVILGMPGPWADDFREESDHYTTKIGGLPDWPIPDLDIAPHMLNCAICGERLCLVAQVYAPISIPKPIGERMIYILGCQMPKCASNPRSWRAIRVQKCEDEKQFDTANSKSATLVEDSATVSKSKNWWDEEEDDDASDDDFDLEKWGQNLAAATSQSPNQNISKRSIDTGSLAPCKPRIKDINPNIPVLPCFYVYSQKSQSPNEVSAVSANYSMLSIKGDNSPSTDHGEEKWEGETYEYDKALGADRTYLKFKKNVDAYPEQCFRYSYGGRPLLATACLVAPATCGICNSSRHYEMQLMPPVLYFLQQAADGSSCCVPEEWSWMTIIIYTCSNSCCPSLCKDKSGSCCWAVIEEAVVIQYE